MIKKIAFLGTAMVLASAAMPAAAQFNSALDTTKQTQSDTKRSQQTIDRLDDETASLLGDYRANLKQYELLTRFNETRRAEIESQGNKIERLQEDLENISTLKIAMVPLISDMLAELEKFVAADMPFYESERSDRIARLKDMMGKTGVSDAERYRKVFEAYEIENEFGRTVNTYEAEVDTPEGPLAVEFLQVGRVALIYKSQDDSVLRIFDKDSGDFVNLDRKFLEDVNFALRVAKKQTAPALLTVPVTAPAASQ